MVLKTDLSVFLANIVPTGAEVLYCPNPGNAGDGVIAHATYQLFERLGIRYHVIDISTPASSTAGRIVIYGGGGNLVEPYPNARGFLQKHHAQAARLILLPHTILAYPELIADMQANVDIFCREMESYQYVRQHLGKANVYLADDVALSIDAARTLALGAHRFWPCVSSLALLPRNAKRIIRRATHSIKNLSHHKCLYAFRNDVEKTGIPIPFANIDISQAFSGDSMSEYMAHEVTYRVLKFIKGFDRVHTNRLHVCISALLLGKKVYFYDNSYGKNRFVYECSFKGRFENLVWMGNSTEIGANLT